MIEYVNGVCLNTLKGVSLNETGIENLKYAIGIQALMCKRAALDLKAWAENRECSEETYVAGIIERSEYVDRLQSDYSRLQRMLIAKSVWVPTN